MEYYSAIKKDQFESVVVKWMNLESLIQNEVSQKEKKRYHLLIHTNGIYKNVTNAFICREAMETQM